MIRTGLLLFLLMAGAALAKPDKFVIVDVLVNGVAHKPTMVMVSGDGAILVRCDDAGGWGLEIRHLPVELVRAIAHIRLTALPGVRASLDATTLRIDATEDAFEGTRIDLQKVSMLALDAGSGAYVNYDLSYFAGRGQPGSTAAALEGVYYRDTFAFINDGVLSSTRLGRRFTRYESSMRWDFPDRVQSLVAGDAICRSGTLARAFRFGGISYGSNFATRPDSVGRALRMMKVSIIGDASSSAKRPSVCAVSPMTRRLSPLGD